jgi:hypothetical protein
MKRNLEKRITVLDAETSLAELLREFFINFFYGFAGNSITVFVAKEVDVAVFINFILFYLFLSFIVNRTKYETYLGKFIILPGAAALGAFSGYKFALWIITLI